MNINLRGYREKVGMSRVEIANILDISNIQLNLYEQASETVPMGLLMRWLQIFGVDIATVMSAPTSPLNARIFPH